MEWTAEKAKGFVRNLGQALLLLTGYGLLVGFVQNLLLFFAVPLLRILQFEQLKQLLASIGDSLQWFFVGFLAFLLVGFIVAFFFRRLKQWAWYGMNGIIGGAVLIATVGVALFYRLLEGLKTGHFEVSMSMVKALVSIAGITVIMVGLAIIRNLNRRVVKTLFVQ